jgi:hypothetical protein
MPQAAAVPGVPGIMSFDGCSCDGGGVCGPCGPCNPDGCGPFCVGDCCGTPPSHRLWLSGEYLLWWIKGQSLPALVTTGSTADAVPGALGQPGTVILYGNGHVENDARSGARFRFGWWFDDEHTIALDGSFFFLGQRSVNFNAGSVGSPALFRPFFNPGFVFNPGTGTFVPTAPFEDAEAVAFPGLLAGGVSVTQKSRLWGYEANLRTNLCNGCCKGCDYTVDGFVGFRSLGLDESLAVGENLVSLSPAVPGTIALRDSFATTNRFYGGQVGLDSELRCGPWFLDLTTKVALGSVHQMVNVSGATMITDATGAVMLSPGGLLTQGSNIGRFTHDHFGVLPEVGVNFGYQLTPGLRCFVGYNFLYLSSVVRPAQQIDRAVNPTLIPLNGSPMMGPAQPSFTRRETDFYAQGLNVGLEFHW